MAGLTRSKLIIVTPGDPDGIGPEVTWKAIQSQSFSNKRIQILCVGPREPFDRLGAPVVEARGLLKKVDLPISKKPFIWLLRAPSLSPSKASHQKPIFLQGYQAGWSVEHAIHLLNNGVGAALVTGPISKERLRAGGFKYNGHTDFLAALCAKKAGTKKNPISVTMMLANKHLRVSLVTTHLPLSSVSKSLNHRNILQTFNHTFDHLKKDCGITCPKIAILGLNPHAGEGGLFGHEERNIIAPVIAHLRKTSRGKYIVSGPHPADTFFAKNHAAQPRDRQDAVICMYHDQALIPVKLLDFPHTVNVTLGLPIIRTSVDHGVAFDIAGKNRADSSSM